jgi:hypothetical protein
LKIFDIGIYDDQVTSGFYRHLLAEIDSVRLEFTKEQ